MNGHEDIILMHSMQVFDIVLQDRRLSFHFKMLYKTIIYLI